MTGVPSKQKKHAPPKHPKQHCKHNLDAAFPIEPVKANGWAWLVGRCWKCECLVALREEV